MATATDAHDTLLGIGKNRDKTYREASAILETVEWALSIANPKGKLLAFVDYLVQNGFERPPKVEKVESAPKVAAPKEEEEEEDRPLIGRKRVLAAKEADASKDSKSVEAEAADDEPIDAEQDAKNCAALAMRMAKAVLARDARGDSEGVLSVLGEVITRHSPFEMQRAAYRGLARLLHPDKFRASEAKAAFQAITKAFDELSAKDPAVSTGRGKQKGVGRSNDGCHRTPIGCPRCHSKWGGPASGLQPYEYTFFMQGLRTYVCCGCLLRFGCMTADHYCPNPECERPINYKPDMYHQTITCKGCKMDFGYKLYTTGPQIEARLREELLANAATRQKKADNDHGRAGRAPIGVPEAQMSERARVIFECGLSEACPKCGFDGERMPKFEEEDDDDDEMEEEAKVIQTKRKKLGAGWLDGERGEKQRCEHYEKCVDRSVHKAYKKYMKEKGQKKDAKAHVVQSQEDVERLAAFHFLGASAQTAWLLTDKQLGKVVADKGLDAEGGRVKQLQQLAASSGVGDASAAGGAQDTIPAHLHGLSVEALRAVCAAHGVDAPEGNAPGTKAKLISLLERRSGYEDVLRLEDCDAKKRSLSNLTMEELRAVCATHGLDEETIQKAMVKDGKPLTVTKARLIALLVEKTNGLVGVLLLKEREDKEPCKQEGKEANEEVDDDDEGEEGDEEMGEYVPEDGNSDEGENDDDDEEEVDGV